MTHGYPATIQKKETNIFEQVEARLLDHCNKIDQLITQLEREIPVHIDERLYMSNATTLTLLPQTQNLELIQCIIAVCSTAAGGTLTLGNRTIPIAMGVTVMKVGDSATSGMLLNNGDLRQVTQANAGNLGLELIGIQIPDKGAWG